MYPESLDCVIDTPDEFYLNTRHIMTNKKPLYFGSVKIQKNYVAFHLMPVYVFPELLNCLSIDLRRRMQGKSCFNFTTVESELFSELSILAESGLSAYRDAGYIK